MDEYYCGYLLEDCIYEWSLSGRQKLVLDVGIWIVDNKVSIRRCSRDMLVSKSTVHRMIHKELPKLSHELYKCVIKQLKLNMDP